MSFCESEFHPLNQPAVKQVLELAGNRKLYLVGGYLRDVAARLNIKATDFDFAVAGASAVDFARLVADRLKGHFVLLDNKNDTARVVIDGGVNLDFAGCLNNDIEIDIKRRDFTVNALAWDPSCPDTVIDRVGALEDLSHKRLRLISEQNLVDDPLRILRAYRFLSLLGFSLDEETRNILKVHKEKLHLVAHERINYEWFLLLNSPNSFDTVNIMGQDGVLEVVFPELTETRRVTKNPFHHLGLFEHSLELIRQAEKEIHKFPAEVVAGFKQELAGGVSRLSATKTACLLHDIGKPATWEITPEGKHTFIKHDQIGADMAKGLANRLKWSTSLEKFVVKLIRWHLRPGHLYQQGEPTPKAMRKFFRVIGDDTPELILLALADLGSTCGDGLAQEYREQQHESMFELLSLFDVYKQGESRIVPFMDGNDVMKLLDLKPGPYVGLLLEAVLEAQALKEINSREEANSFVKKQFTSWQKDKNFPLGSSSDD